MSITGTTRLKQKDFTLVFLSISSLGLMATAVLDTVPNALAQTTTSPPEKEDIFKVIMTVQGLTHNTGDIVTIVSVNGESRVKLFDDSKTYIHSVKADGTGGIVEYVATFPNMTVKTGDVFKACVLTIKGSNLICETGTNSPALRPEFKDLFVQGERSTPSSHAAKISDEE